MATSTRQENKKCISISNICQGIEYTLKKCMSQYNIQFDCLQVFKRSKDLKYGDICVPNYPALVTISATDGRKHECFVQDLGKKLSDEPNCFVKSVQTSPYSFLTIYLDHKNVFTQTIRFVLDAGDGFGHSIHCREQRVLINPADFHGHFKNKDSMITADSLHSLIVMQHSQKILVANGYDVSYITFNHISRECLHLVELLGIDISFNSERTVVCKHLIEIARKSEYFKEIDSHKEAEQTETFLSQNQFASSKSFPESDTFNQSDHGVETGKDVPKTETTEVFQFKESRNCSCHKSSYSECEDEAEKYTSIVLDVGKFIEKQDIGQGKGKFDKKINLVEVIKDGHITSIFHQMALLENNLPQDEVSAVILHVVPQRQAFSQQKVDLLWKLLGHHSEKLSQIHLIVGTVESRKSCDVIEDSSANAVFQLRYKQMEEVSVMKYGDDVYHCSGWEDTIMSLTVASIKFEFLHSSCKNVVKLDLSEKGDVMRSGSFVMYNCARMSTLFKHFHEAVANGLYPPLPPVEEIDFGKLKEEEEWVLLYNYVLPFPELIASTVEELVSGSGEIQPKIHTHKVCNFLHGLSRSISSYYSRTHILGECVPHLLPVMYARLYLMMAVHQVMQNALVLMGITPLSQL